MDSGQYFFPWDQKFAGPNLAEVDGYFVSVGNIPSTNPLEQTLRVFHTNFKKIHVKKMPLSIISPVFLTFCQFPSSDQYGIGAVYHHLIHSYWEEIDATTYINKPFYREPRVIMELIRPINYF